MLDGFRSIDVKWNNAYDQLPDIRTAQHDNKGRKIAAQITDNGEEVDTTGANLRLVTKPLKSWGVNKNITLDSYSPRTFSEVIPTESKWGIDSGDEGRNLLLDSGAEVSNNAYRIRRYVPSEFLVEGEEYTVTLCVTPAEGVERIELSSGGQTQGKLYTSGTEKQIISMTVNVRYRVGRHPSDNPTNGNVDFFRFPNDGTVTTNSTIHWAIVTKGDQIHPYSPAPEDFQNLKGTQYNLSEPIKQNEPYTLSLNETLPEDDYLGVWLGDYFAGYVRDGKLRFNLFKGLQFTPYGGQPGLEYEFAELKLEKGDMDTPYTPSPSDLILDKLTLKSLSSEGEVSRAMLNEGEEEEWGANPSDLIFNFDLIEAQKGIYELYIPKIVSDNYKVAPSQLELLIEEDKIVSDTFKINMFEGVD